MHIMQLRLCKSLFLKNMLQYIMLNVSKAGYSTFLEIHFCVTISLVNNDEILCNFGGKLAHISTTCPASLKVM